MIFALLLIPALAVLNEEVNDDCAADEDVGTCLFQSKSFLGKEEQPDGAVDVCDGLAKKVCKQTPGCEVKLEGTKKVCRKDPAAKEAECEDFSNLEKCPATCTWTGESCIPPCEGTTACVDGDDECELVGELCAVTCSVYMTIEACDPTRCVWAVDSMSCETQEEMSPEEKLTSTANDAKILAPGNGKYAFGRFNVDNCQTGTNKLSSPQDCEAAAEALGLPGIDFDDTDKAPKGCFLDAVEGNRVFFNTRLGGNTRSEFTRSICERIGQAPPPITTAAPVVTDAPTDAPVVTTAAPVVTDAPTDAPVVTTAAPVVTDAPTDAPVVTDPPTVAPAGLDDATAEAEAAKAAARAEAVAEAAARAEAVAEAAKQPTAEPMPTETPVVCPEMAEIQVKAEAGTCHVAGRSIAELAVAGLFGDNVEIKSVRYAEQGATGFDLNDILLTVGLHPITVEAVDLAGNTRACTRHIRVMDSQNPVWSPDPPLAYFKPEFQPGECTMSSLHAVNSFEGLGWKGGATDNCENVKVRTTVTNLAHDTLYDSEGETTGILNLGAGASETYQINYVATDEAGNFNSHVVELSLHDLESPTEIHDCPEDAYYEIDDDDTMHVHPHTWVIPTVSKDNCLPYHPMDFPASTERSGFVPGHEFPLGATLVAYDITDPAGNAYGAGCDFTVTVKQRVTDPVWMECPDDITIETEADADFGILPELTGKAEQNGVELEVTYDHGVTAGMPFHFGTTHLTMRTESGTHLAECTFKITVNDRQRPKVDGRIYRCMDMDTDDAEPFAVCEGPLPSITKDVNFIDTHQYIVDKIATVGKACCDDVHGVSYTCYNGGEGWTSSYCTPNGH